MSLTLFYHPLSSYCHKVLVALYQNDVEFVGRIINLGDQAERAELAALWPLIKFPVIRDEDRQRNLGESSIIIEYLVHFFPGTVPLIPEDWEAALEVRSWDRFLDNHVHASVQSIVGHRIAGRAACRSANMRPWRPLTACLKRSLPGAIGLPLTASAWLTAPQRQPCSTRPRWRRSRPMLSTCRLTSSG